MGKKMVRDRKSIENNQEKSRVRKKNLSIHSTVKEIIEAP